MICALSLRQAVEWWNADTFTSFSESAYLGGSTHLCSVLTAQ